MADGGRSDFIPATTLDRLFDDCADLARRREQALREASAAWLDLALGYARDSRSEAPGVTRRDGTLLSNRKLERILHERTVEEFQLAQMVRQLNTCIAVIAQEPSPDATPARGVPQR